LSPVKMFQCSKLPCLGWRSADFLQGFFRPKCSQEQLKHARSSTKISMGSMLWPIFSHCLWRWRWEKTPRASHRKKVCISPILNGSQVQYFLVNTSAKKKSAKAFFANGWSS
jgi:hypothetical protein